MAAYKLLYTAIGIMVFVAVIIGGRLFLMESLGKAKIEEKTAMGELNGITAAHLVAKCLKNGKRAIERDFLERNGKRRGTGEGKNLCELCGICSVMVEANVSDTESGDFWIFEYGTLSRSWQWLKEKAAVWKKEKHYSYSISVNIADGDEIHVGELSVRV